ncbi:MAG TPA: AsmA family protein, partial [Kiritimatiellia bacterium]|nr:AsmA family protein [Kiritimatiellia bacterium]
NLTVLRFKVGNPQGYSDKDAFAVDKVEVGLNMRSLLSDTIVVRKIQIDAPAISFESKEGKSNFDTMMANVKKSSAEEKDKAKAPEGEKKPGKKVIIEEFTLNNGQVAFTSGLTLGKGITLPLPSITVRDIGKESGGASAVEALTEVMNSVLGGLSKAVSGAASAAGDLLKGAGDAVSGAAKGATDALKGAASGAADAAKGVTDTLKGATSGATDAAKGVTDTLKGVTSGATDAAKGATSGTTGTADDAVKTAEGTVKGAADAAKATTDKLKKLNPFGK